MPETLLLNPEASPDSVYQGRVSYQFVSKHADLHMQHGVYAYPEGG